MNEPIKMDVDWAGIGYQPPKQPRGCVEEEPQMTDDELIARMKEMLGQE